jgi:hypothetical protein
MEKEKEEAAREVRVEIKKHLAKCDASATPKICELIKTPEGYRKVESMVIFLLIYGQTGIGAAIAQVEMEML